MATAIEFDNVGKQYRYQPDSKERKAVFVASCVECAADREGVAATEMYLRMQRVNLIEDYILPCYDVLHAESRENVTADILKTLRIWEDKKLPKK